MALQVQEFCTSSGHIPVILSLGLVLAGDACGLQQVVPALVGGVLQAWIIGLRAQRGLPVSFLANLAGAAIFAAAMAAIDWRRVPVDPTVHCYAVGSLLLATCRWAVPRLPEALAEAVQVVEHVVRTSVFVAVYAIIQGQDLRVFLASPGHRFLLACAVLLGGLLGGAAILRRREFLRSRTLAERLRSYSEMLLGRSLLTRAIGHSEVIEPRRTRRSVLFADIRGFTSWSEMRSPEEVVAMLGTFYEAADAACAPFKPKKVKHTGDEAMMFFADPMAAAGASLALRVAAERVLVPLGLHVGIGLHHGDVIEGLIGSQQTKAYDILGDTVNTAKRVCDHAGPGRVMITYGFHDACRGRIRVGEDSPIMAKGKSSAVMVAELLEILPAAPA